MSVTNMWVIIKYKSKNLKILKSNILKKFSMRPRFYCPKIKLQKYHHNHLKEFEKIILDGYLLCYYKEFENKLLFNQLNNIEGSDYILSGSKENQKDIIKFINYCRSFEDEDGYLRSTFLSILKSKYVQFLSGPFTKMMFQVISANKNKLKILIGNSTATIEKTKYHYQRC